MPFWIELGKDDEQLISKARVLLLRDCILSVHVCPVPSTGQFRQHNCTSSLRSGYFSQPFVLARASINGSCRLAAHRVHDPANITGPNGARETTEGVSRAASRKQKGLGPLGPEPPRKV